MKTIEHYKQLDDMICDEVNIKAYNRVLASEPDKIELQYVRSLRRYNLRLNGKWLKDADDEFVVKVLNEFQPITC